MKPPIQWTSPAAVIVRLLRHDAAPAAGIVLLWFLLIVPAISLRGAHYEEGTTIVLTTAIM